MSDLTPAGPTSGGPVSVGPASADPAPSAFRCSAASAGDAEPLAGTAPTDTAWLLVEHAGPWGRQAVAESRLPAEVRAFLGGLADVRVQLIRRHAGAVSSGVRVFAGVLGPEGAQVETALLDDVSRLLDLDVAGLAAGRLPGAAAGFAPYDEGLWLVCTNGRRDLCCADLGRPVTAVLCERWPEQTWETSHLGGHRFAATLLALPSGVALGRLDPVSAVEACAELADGEHPGAWSRGRAGVSGAAQVAEVHVREQLGVSALGAVRVVDVAATGREAESAVTVEVAGEPWRVVVRTGVGAAQRQSCADLKTKPAATYDVVSCQPADLG
ncbi:sucrase ferredoxin [Nocardioides pacificus]